MYLITRLVAFFIFLVILGIFSCYELPDCPAILGSLKTQLSSAIIVLRNPILQLFLKHRAVLCRTESANNSTNFRGFNFTMLHKISVFTNQTPSR